MDFYGYTPNFVRNRGNYRTKSAFTPMRTMNYLTPSNYVRKKRPMYSELDLPKTIQNPYTEKLLKRRFAYEDISGVSDSNSEPYEIFIPVPVLPRVAAKQSPKMVVKNARRRWEIPKTGFKSQILVFDESDTETESSEEYIYQTASDSSPPTDPEDVDVEHDYNLNLSLERLKRQLKEDLARLEEEKERKFQERLKIAARLGREMVEEQRRERAQWIRAQKLRAMKEREIEYDYA